MLYLLTSMAGVVWACPVSSYQRAPELFLISKYTAVIIVCML